MFTKIGRSWDLTKQSWAVLRADKHLMVFPLVSGLLTTLVCVSFFIPIVLFSGLLSGGSPGHVAGASGEGAAQVDPAWRLAGYGLMFVLYFVINVIVTFFNASLISCAIARFNGEDSSAKAGMKAALKRWPQILGWALLNATVGVLLQWLKEKAGWIGRIVLGFVGLAWTIATFFVVPVLVVEGLGPIASVKRSVEVLKKTWGESLVAQVGVSLAMGLIGMAIFLPLVVGGVLLMAMAEQFVLGLTLIALAVLALVLIGLVSSTLKMILVAACYRMATTGLVPEQFDGPSLRGMIGRK